MAGNKGISDSLTDLQGIISLNHKYDIKIRKHTRKILSEKGAYVKDEYDIILVTAIPYSLADVIEEATGYMIEDTRKLMQY